MKATKFIFSIALLLLAFTSVQAQKMWISGNYLNSWIQYIENGELVEIATVWDMEKALRGTGLSDASSLNHRHIVLYGEFITYQEGSHFEVEKFAYEVSLISGTFTEQKYDCPTGTKEGILTLDNGAKQDIVLYEPFISGQEIVVTDAEWGTKVCNGEIFSVYYVRSAHGVSRVLKPGEYIEQRIVESTITTNDETRTITGTIVSRNSLDRQGYGLDIPNWATFRTTDGQTIEISSNQPINSNGQITLKGYSKLTYYTGVRKAEYVFYVTEFNQPSNTTTINSTGSKVTVADANAALAFHNKARADVGVAPLRWSTGLSRYAQEWAEYLAGRGCILEHREGAYNVEGYGENIAGGNITTLKASELWYSEIKDFKNVVLNSSNWYDTGHYSQMVWRNTTEVGMGAARCADGRYIVVANYNPTGNYMGQKAY